MDQFGKHPLRNLKLAIKQLLIISCLFCVSGVWASERQDAAEKLFNLINQRLSYMEDVAIYKAKNNLPIEDKNREKDVIQSASEASAKSGIKSSSAENFFREQIEVAKFIQRQVLKRYSKAVIQSTSPRDLKEEIRPRLIDLGNQILHQISHYIIHYGSMSETDYMLFTQKVNNTYLEESRKKQLFETLRQIELSQSLPKGFVRVLDVIPDIVYELRYFGTHNFVGSKIDGYFANQLILTEKATEALAKVQLELKPFGLGLMVYDAYRPQRAVDHFVRWAEDIKDVKTKSEFYPDVPKSELFQQDYIARRSGHTRGSTLDLTIVINNNKRQLQVLDMGSPYDFFGKISWPFDGNISAQQRANRMLLRTLMIKHGFKPYPKEWWHFTLADEPFSETYFDFPIVD